MIRVALFGALAGIAPIGLAQIDASRVVATVNGDPIVAGEYYSRMEFLDTREIAQSLGNRVATLPPGFLTMYQLIGERLIYQLARSRSALPTEPEFSAEIQAVVQLEPKALQVWLDAGRSRAEFDQKLRYELVKFKLQSAGITVTDLEIEKFHKDNPTRFTTPKLFKLKVIVLSDAAKKAQVDAELASGKPFAEVAKAMSDDVSKISGGDFGVLPLSGMTEKLSVPVGATKIGQTTAWIDADGTWLKFLVEDITAEKLQPLDAALRRGIRRQLMLDRGRVKNDVSKDLLALRGKSQIEIKIPWFMDLYKQLTSQQGSGG